MDFDSLQDDSVTQAQKPAPAPSQDPAQQSQQQPMAFDSMVDDTEKYGGTGQQLLGGAESLAKGFLPFGHTLVAGAEKGLTDLGVSGLTAEDQAGREESLKSINPYLPAAGEAAGFGLGFLTGGSELTTGAKLLSKAGEAAQGLAGLSETVSLGEKLAAGAVKAGTELAGMQADDEVSKVINGSSKGVGDAITNIGLASALGGVGGGIFKGAGLATKGALDAIGLKEFADRLAFRGANAHPNEMVEKEFNDAISQYHAMNSELTGSTGLKAQALEKIMPKEVSPELTGQIQDIMKKAGDLVTTSEDQKATGAIKEMVAQGVPERYIAKYTNHLNDLKEVIGSENPTPSKIFDALNTFKQDLQGYSKGNYGPFAVPSYHEAYDFLNITKNLGHEVKEALEDSKVWGGVADLQKKLNSSWTKVLPAVKDVQSKFMEKIGGDYVPSPQKFQTYVNQNGRATSQTIRQKMMGNFVDSIENHFNATDAAYKAAGLENPFPPPGMGSLKESLQKTSIGSKLADMWYDKLGSEAIGNALGAAAGEAVAPGIGGAYVGKETLGKLFGSIIKPVAEKVSSLPGYQAAMSFVKHASQGDSKLATAAGNLFLGASKTVPNHWIPDVKQITQLDERLKSLQANQSGMLDMTGELPHYLPDHAQKLSETAMNAVNTLNSQRPTDKKVGPLDSPIPPSKMEQAQFQRKLAVAQQPLVVLQHIQDGTLLPQDVATLKSIYPEYYDKMSQVIMSAMNDHIHGENSIPYKIKQGLSLFLAQPMDSTMTPGAIQSIQSVFAPQQSAPQPGGGKPKGSPSKLNKVGSSLETPAQARETRQNKT